MSLQNNIVTTFKAETAGYVAAVKHMRGVERDEMKQTLATLEQQNAKLTDQLAVLGKATAAVGAVAIAWKAAQAAANAHLEDLRLEAAAAGADIDRLRDATRGLVETDNLLAFAGKSMHGVWKLNQAEMETAAKGTRVLAKDLGIDLQTAMEGVTEAVTKGTTKSLKELGIEVKDKTGLMETMSGAAKRWGQTGTDEGEKWQKASVGMADAWDDLKGALGQMVVALSPVVEMIAKLVSDIVELISLPAQAGASLASVWGDTLSPGLLGLGGRQPIATMGQRQARAFGGTDPFSLDALHTDDLAMGSRIADLAHTGYDVLESGIIQANARAKKFVEDAQKHRDYDALDHGMVALEGTVARVPWGAVAGPVGLGGPGAIDSFAPGRTIDGFRELGGADDQADLKRFQEEMAGIRQQWEEMQAATRGPTVLERIFGKPDDITATVVAIEAATAATNMFAQAGGAAMGAWIDGEQSMADAIKGVLADSLKALAIESTVKALFHLAAAAGSAAFGNFASAGAHLKTAGMYGAVAVAAGVGAKAAHNAGWSGSTSASGGGAGAALGGGSRGSFGGDDRGSGERNVTIMLGKDFGFFTDIEQRSLMYQAIRQSQKGGGNHVRFE